MSTAWIRVAFGVVFAVLAAYTVIFGVAMAFPGPKPPGDPGITFRQLSQSSDSTDNRSQNQLTQQIDQFFGDASRFRNEFPTYQRNVFLSATGLGVLVVLIGLLLPAAVNYLRLGFLLGGVLVFAYAFFIATRPIPRVAPDVSGILAMLGVGFPDRLNFAGRFLQFAAAFIGLILTLFLGLWRLTEWGPPSPRRVVAAAPLGPSVPVGSAQWAPAPAPAPPPAPVSTPAPVIATAPVVAPAATPSGDPLPAPAPASDAGEVRGQDWRRPDQA